MSGMRKAFKVSSGGKVGVVVPDEVAHQIAGAVHAVLLEHMDELVAVNWTLNYAYREDGDQVVCHYPDLLKRFVQGGARGGDADGRGTAHPQS